MRTGRRVLLLGLCAAPAARFAAPPARAELADALAAQVEANPALAAVARRDPALARRLAAEATALLTGGPGGLRSAALLDEADAALLRDNPMLGAVYRHDPAAALDLLTRVKQAGGTRR